MGFVLENIFGSRIIFGEGGYVAGSLWFTG